MGGFYIFQSHSQYLQTSHISKNIMSVKESDSIRDMSPPTSTPCLQAYLDWVKGWQSVKSRKTFRSDILLEDAAGEIVRGTHDPQLLAEVVTKFKRDAELRTISTRAKVPPRAMKPTDCQSNSILD